MTEPTAAENRHYADIVFSTARDVRHSRDLTGEEVYAHSEDIGRTVAALTEERDRLLAMLLTAEAEAAALNDPYGAIFGRIEEASQ